MNVGSCVSRECQGPRYCVFASSEGSHEENCEKPGVDRVKQQKQRSELGDTKVCVW